MSSLPVPVSPRIKTDAVVSATSYLSLELPQARRWPTMLPKLCPLRHFFPQVGILTSSRTCSCSISIAVGGNIDEHGTCALPRAASLDRTGPTQASRCPCGAVRARRQQRTSVPRPIEPSASRKRRWASGVSGTRDFPNIPAISSRLDAEDPHSSAVSLDKPRIKAPHAHRRSGPRRKDRQKCSPLCTGCLVRLAELLRSSHARPVPGRRPSSQPIAAPSPARPRSSTSRRIKVQNASVSYARL